MASYFTVTLDTTAPAGVSISLAGGAATTNVQAITATIGTSDGDTTGYQMKIWGNVDESANANIQDAEGDSSWIAFSTSQSVTLSSGDGSKTVYVKVRDDVWNESAQQSDSITLDTSAPTPTLTSGPDVTRISKIAGKRTVTFSWQADVGFEEYKVKVVPATNSVHSAGTGLLTTNGSTNVSGSAGSYPAETPITTAIDGRDLDVASSGDGAKIVKVFVKDASNNWSSV
jgi:hypothetical protein